MSTYTGPSIVDYLSSIGKPSDITSRKLLAQSLGIQNYRGTAQENTQMLDTLRKQTPPVAPSATTPPAQPAPATTPTAPATPQVTKMGTPVPTTPATFTETYKTALENTGVSSIKKAFDDTQNAYDTLQNKLNDEIAEVGNNPWISEGLRSRKITALQSRYEGKLGILTNKLKLYDSLHQQAQIEAKFLASGEQDQSQFDTNVQMKLFELAQKEAEAEAKLLEINPTNFKEVQGGLVDVSTGTWVIPPPTPKGTPEKILSVTEAQTLGVPYGTTESQAIKMGKTPQRATTVAQETTALYASRLEQSGKIIDQLDTYAMSENPLAYKLQQNLPQVLNTLKSANFQSVDQAQRNFINAVLRRESGAVISPTEFDNARQQYFALPGDPPSVVAQKKANRDIVIKGFISGAGHAYTPSIGSGILKSPDGTQQVNSSDLTPAQIKEAQDAGWK